MFVGKNFFLMRNYNVLKVFQKMKYKFLVNIIYLILNINNISYSVFLLKICKKECCPHLFLLILYNKNLT